MFFLLIVIAIYLSYRNYIILASRVVTIEILNSQDDVITTDRGILINKTPWYKKKRINIFNDQGVYNVLIFKRSILDCF